MNRQRDRAAWLAGTVAVAFALSATGPARSAGTPGAEDRRLECTGFLIGASEAEIIRDVGVRDGTVGVVVDAGVWSEMTRANRTEMAEAINCWVFDGEEGRMAHLQFLDHRDHAIIADWGPEGLRSRR